MVSVGELGTKPDDLEKNLSTILDISHVWGALLLIDEADVFLEQREYRDIHRNALVTVFLRQLEYFQGILFLTTNRVENFDGAFKSRIHIGLQYDKLDIKARRSIWKLYLDQVKALPGARVADITEDEWRTLSKEELNGREVQNLPFNYLFILPLLLLLPLT